MLYSLQPEITCIMQPEFHLPDWIYQDYKGIRKPNILILCANFMLELLLIKSK